jgi:hypothetical protein
MTDVCNDLLGEAAGPFFSWKTVVRMKQGIKADVQAPRGVEPAAW